LELLLLLLYMFVLGLLILLLAAVLALVFRLLVSLLLLGVALPVRTWLISDVEFGV
jgi:hypothetical protein